MNPEPPTPSKLAVELDELVERIRRAAGRQHGLITGVTREGSATSDLPPVPDPLPPPSPSAGTADAPGGTRPETLLDEAASMLLGGRKKTTVPGGVPKLLRRFFRNQGGYNSVLLEAAERLLEVNRTLRRENSELHDRLMELHTWAHTVAQASTEHRDWILAADARLSTLTEQRLSRLEARLARLENPPAPGPRDDEAGASADGA